mgnify:CR=1 FL=1
MSLLRRESRYTTGRWGYWSTTGQLADCSDAVHRNFENDVSIDQDNEFSRYTTENTGNGAVGTAGGENYQDIVVDLSTQ